MLKVSKIFKINLLLIFLPSKINKGPRIMTLIMRLIKVKIKVKVKGKKQRNILSQSKNMGLFSKHLMIKKCKLNPPGKTQMQIF